MPRCEPGRRSEQSPEGDALTRMRPGVREANTHTAPAKVHPMGNIHRIFYNEKTNRMKKILLPGLVTGLALLVVGMLTNAFLGAVFPALQSEYQTSGLFRPWSDPRMSLIFLNYFIQGVILAWVWSKTKTLFPINAFWKKGGAFALAYWVVGLPGMIITYSSFRISSGLVVSWTVMGLIEALCAGFVLSKMNK